jgi:hypothetical protein
VPPTGLEREQVATQQAVQSNPWTRTTSPEEAIHLCGTAFYPQRLTLLGSSTGFAFSQRVTQVGPITAGDITYGRDVRLGFDEARGGYHVSIPIVGRLESWHPADLPINTSTTEVLRRPVESANYTSRQFAETLKSLRIRQSVGRTGICLR